MLNVAELMNRHVELLQDIPDLMVMMRNEPHRIFAFHDNMPARTSPGYVWYAVGAPSIMLLWESTGAQEGEMDQWLHTVVAYVRCDKWDDSLRPPSGFYRICQLMYLGTPTSIGRPMKDICILSSVGPLSQYPPEFTRDTDPEGVDFWRVTHKFAEIGDYNNAP